MVINYNSQAFDYGAADIPLSKLWFSYKNSHCWRTRRNHYFMMVAPPSLLPDITKARMELLEEVW